MIELIALAFIVLLILAAWRKLSKQMDSLSDDIERIRNHMTTDQLWSMLHNRLDTHLIDMFVDTRVSKENLEHLVKTIQVINFQDHRAAFNTLLRAPNKPRLLEEELIQGIDEGTFEISGIPCKYFLTIEERTKALKYLEEILD